MLKRIKALREAVELSQDRLGKIVAVSQQSINSYENTNTEPDIKTLSRLADYFNTSIDYLVEYTDIPHKIEPVTPCELNEKELWVMEAYRMLPPKRKMLLEQLLADYTDKPM